MLGKRYAASVRATTLAEQFRDWLAGSDYGDGTLLAVAAGGAVVLQPAIRKFRVKVRQLAVGNSVSIDDLE